MIASRESVTSRPRLAAALLAATLSGLLHVAALAVRRLYPFGDRSLGLGDWTTQYYAFHARLLHALSGSPTTSIGFTWSQGSGMPTLADYAYYTGGPFPLMLLPFGLARLDLGMTVMVLAKLICTAAASALLLQRVAASRRSVLAPALGGALVSCSGWVFGLGRYTPMWLDGALWLPLLVLVGLWCHERRRLVAGVGVVALTFCSNFYAGYMAALGASLLTLTVLIAARTPWRETALAMVRFTIVGLLGVATSALLLAPTLLVLADGAESAAVALQYPHPLIVASSLLSGTGGAGKLTPAFTIGALPLLLALSLPAARHLPRWERVTWSVATLLMVVVSLSPWGCAIWSMFQPPHGNPFRFGFVLSLWIAVCAIKALPMIDGRSWAAPSWPAVLVGGAGLMLCTLITGVAALTMPETSRWFSVSRWFWLPPLLACGVAGLWSRRLLRASTCATLAAGLALLDVSWGGKVTDHFAAIHLVREPVRHTTWAARRIVAESATATADWPVGRVSLQSLAPMNPLSLPDYPSWVDMPSTQYATSAVGRSTGELYEAVGYATHVGRIAGWPTDEYADQLLAVRARLNDTSVTPLAGMPFARVVSGVRGRDLRQPPPRGAGTARTAAARNDLLDSPAFRAVPVTLTDAEGKAVAASPIAGRTRFGASAQRIYQVRVNCAPHEQAELDLRAFVGTAHIGGRTVDAAQEPGIVVLPASGTASVEPRRTALLGGLCVDDASVRRQVEAARGATHLALGRDGRIDAAWDAPQSGTALLATPAAPGWTCSRDGKPTSVRSVHGMLAVPMDGQRTVVCEHHAPGLGAGAATSLLALLTTGLWAWAERRGRQRRLASRPMTAATSRATS